MKNYLVQRTKYKLQDTPPSGFTMVEMAIVLVVVGLLIAGVMTGRSMIRKAQLSSIIVDVGKYKSAVLDFKLKYLDLPGDIGDAFNYWGANCATSAGLCNGDSNGQISIGVLDEDTKAWVHLSLAGFVDGSFTAGGDPNPPINIPGSDLGQNVGFWLRVYTNPALYLPANVTENIITFGILNGTAVDGGVITAQEAWSIDRKIDDGDADSGQGFIWATDGTGAGQNNCVDGTNEYILTNETDRDCVLHFRFNAT